MRAVRTSLRSAPPEPPITPISSWAGTVSRPPGAQGAGDGEEADRQRVEHADGARIRGPGLTGDHRDHDRGRDHGRQIERVGQRDRRSLPPQQQISQQAAAEAAREGQAEHADEVEAVLPARRERAAGRPGGDPE